jgi:hypothetical protein
MKNKKNYSGEIFHALEDIDSLLYSMSSCRAQNYHQCAFYNSYSVMFSFKNNFALKFYENKNAWRCNFLNFFVIMIDLICINMINIKEVMLHTKLYTPYCTQD